MVVVEAGEEGVRLWEASLVLCERILTCTGRELSGRVVLELGAGVGLCGLASARFAPSTLTLTDGSEAAMVLLLKNLALNGISATIASASGTQTYSGIARPVCEPTAPSHDAFAAPTADGCPRSPAPESQTSTRGGPAPQRSGGTAGVVTQILTWCDPPTDAPKADVILGADLVYQGADISGLAATIAGYLAVDGTAYIVSPCRRRGRDRPEGSVEALIAGLTERGLDVQEQSLGAAEATIQEVPSVWRRFGVFMCVSSATQPKRFCDASAQFSLLCARWPPS